MALPLETLNVLFDPGADEDQFQHDDDYVEEYANVESSEQPSAEPTDVEYEYEPLQEEEEEEDEKEEASEVEYEADDGEEHQVRQLKSIEEREAEHQERAAAFMALLRDRGVDPFRPWSQISAELGSEPAFLAIASAKEREALFAVISPELAERIRSARQGKLAEAECGWASMLVGFKEPDLAKLPPTWTEFSRQLRKVPSTAAWLSILDTRRLEKEYRARIAELKKAAQTYNVRSNKL